MWISESQVLLSLIFSALIPETLLIPVWLFLCCILARLFKLVTLPLAKVSSLPAATGGNPGGVIPQGNGADTRPMGLSHPVVGQGETVLS